MQPMNRREFLKLSGFAGALTALTSCQSIPADEITHVHEKPTLEPFTITNEDEWLIFQTLRRITFGPRREDLNRAKEIGLDNFIDEQLACETIDDHEADLLITDLDYIFMAPGELIEVEQRGQPVAELIKAAVIRAIYSKRQLYELMVDFWSNHFNLYVRKDLVGLLKIIDDRDVIRPHALGNFHDLLSASAHSPAMLVYLDNAQSSQEHPNENYARELLELHTLGVDGGYTHEDILETARALTGWSVSKLREDNPGFFQFRSRQHDFGEKTILGQHFSSGQGVKDGEELLVLLANHSSTANFICEKLVRRFVADDPPAELITRAADTFIQSKGDLKEVMSTILHSKEFKDSLGMKFKRPFEYLVSALRMTESEVDPGRFTGQLLAQMGQLLFNWATPDGYPDEKNAWTSTNGMLSRWNYALAVAFNVSRDSKVEWDSLTGDSGSVRETIDLLSSRLLGGSLNEDLLQIMLDFSNLYSQDLTTPAIGALLLASPFFQYR
ncbi:MAG: DUF1800 family protein [Anaerolineales bacterium]